MKLLEKVRPWAGIIALIGIGVSMIMDPDMAMAIEVTGRRQGVKSLLKAIWGLPAGLIMVAIGGVLGYFQVKKKPEDRSVE
ncbi:hypothetical protein [Aquimarina agarilytica]|uniref:hypothetical protein n=1 Tax=Aquimarina agarilytica TaxID=1087449 RepID=UPI000288C081|nr:hypothetical protein [Aquimarina agarilytica]